MLKILQARLQQYLNHELSDVQSGFKKGRGTRDQIAHICWVIKKEESSRKTSISVLLSMPKPLTVWIIINCGKFWKRWESQTTWLPSWETCMQVRKQQLELDMLQFSSVLSHVRLFATPWIAASQASLSITISQSSLRLASIASVMPSSHLILGRPLLLLPSIFPSIRVFSNESALCIRSPKYRSFSFSISPSNVYSGLISFRIYWFDLLAVKGILRSLL